MFKAYVDQQKSTKLVVFPSLVALHVVCMLIRSFVSDSLATPWTVAHQAPLSMEFPKQEYWSGLPFPPPGHIPNPGVDPKSPALEADSLPLSYLGRATGFRYIQ